MEITPKLILNKHPKDFPDMTLARAFNVMVDKDDGCLTNEESIVMNNVISEKLNTDYSNGFLIVGVIPCNIELVLIVISKSQIEEIKNGTEYVSANIYRYREKSIYTNEGIKLFYEDFHYHGGLIKGAFTYNVEDSLVVAISEYDTKTVDKVPLRSINLGQFDDVNTTNLIPNDLNLKNELTTLSPDIYIPSLNGFDYIPGSAYKGWYHFFIRFKINTVDYTQWYQVGQAIYVDVINQTSIIKYCYNRVLDNDNSNGHVQGHFFPILGAISKNDDGYCTGFSDYFSDTADICSDTILLDINLKQENDTLGYKKCQVGFICLGKSYTKCYASEDLDITDFDSFSIKIDYHNFNESTASDMVMDYMNLFNVRSIINYKNRLYVGNYGEQEANISLDRVFGEKKLSEYVNAIRCKLETGFDIADPGLTYTAGIVFNNKDDSNIDEKEKNTQGSLGSTVSSQYDNMSDCIAIKVSDYIGCNEEALINIIGNVNNGNTYTLSGEAGKFYIIAINTKDSVAYDENYGYIAIVQFESSAILRLCCAVSGISELSNVTYTISLNSDSSVSYKLCSKDCAAIRGNKYINSYRGFENRKKQSTLIPGEIYNFFIHYVDRYGFATNGYRIGDGTDDDGWTGGYRITTEYDNNDGGTDIEGVEILGQYISDEGPGSHRVLDLNSEDPWDRTICISDSLYQIKNVETNECRYCNTNNWDDPVKDGWYLLGNLAYCGMKDEYDESNNWYGYWESFGYIDSDFTNDQKCWHIEDGFLIQFTAYQIEDSKRQIITEYDQPFSCPITNVSQLKVKTLADSNDSDSEEIIPVKFQYNDKVYYVAVPINVTVYELLNNIMKGNYENYQFYIYDGYEVDDLTHTIKLTNPLPQYLGGKVYDSANLEYAFLKAYQTFNDEKYKDYYWYQIAEQLETEFGTFINNLDQRLYKVPIGESFIENEDSVNSYKIESIVNCSNSEGYNTPIASSNIGTLYTKRDRLHRCYYPKFENIEIPEGYIGYFISYEKMESYSQVTGLLTRCDATTKEQVRGRERSDEKYTVYRRAANMETSDSVQFHSSIFDISDSTRIDYDMIRIEGKNIFDTLDWKPYFYFQRNNAFKHPYDLNKPQVDKHDFLQVLPMLKSHIVPANSATGGLFGRGTALIIEDEIINHIFPVIADTDSYAYNTIQLYRATICNTTRNRCNNSNKTLIRMSDVIYEDTASITLKTYLNGHWSIQGSIVYSQYGVTLDTTTNTALMIFKGISFCGRDKVGDTENEDAGYKLNYEADYPIAAYMQMPVCTNEFFESKSFNNEPQSIIYSVHPDTDHPELGTYAGGCFVIPQDSIDLFANKIGAYDDYVPKTYLNYQEDLIDKYDFKRTIRRSAVIQDESRVNNWRIFSSGQYKYIIENKGDITNLIGMGTMLLVHTQHSLFAFDTSNVLKTQDKDVQLDQQDVFDIDYKEVLTSDLGYGGLQDDLSYVVDQFGYIYYNDDFRRFYLFSGDKIATMDDDIVEWLQRYKPYGVRFANDKRNNRIIIKMLYDIADEQKEIFISFSFGAKAFVSLHNYHFDRAYNSKSIVYLHCDNIDSQIHNSCPLHNFVDDGTSYGWFDNIISNIGESTRCDSIIGVMTNGQRYDMIKYFESLMYKLNKHINNALRDITTQPFEDYTIPFSGDYLTIYNRDVNTGELDISTFELKDKNIFCNYKKPYWDLGNWNFSYLRNRISEYGQLLGGENEYGNAYLMSRLFGNYFIIEFKFTNLDKQKVELESITPNLTISRL